LPNNKPRLFAAARGGEAGFTTKLICSAGAERKASVCLHEEEGNEKVRG
jgi:hypothetical protein